jgi:hypothetical protein
MSLSDSLDDSSTFFFKISVASFQTTSSVLFSVTWKKLSSLEIGVTVSYKGKQLLTEHSRLLMVYPDLMVLDIASLVVEWE